MLSERLRRLDRRLQIDHSGQSEWVWAVPALAFVAILAILVVAGMMSGVWAAEYIPTGLVVALVISGLLVACMTPEAFPPGDDHGGRRPDTEPLPTPPTRHPGIWVTLLADTEAATVPSGSEHDQPRQPEPVGATSGPA